MARIVLLANKGWEADAIGAVFTNAKAVPPKLGPWISQGRGLRLTLTNGGLDFEFWCVQDLMDPKQSPSSTQEKWRILPQVFAYKPDSPALVVSIGTASLGDILTYNGCVVAGTRAFVHNVYAENPNPASTWSSPLCDQLLLSHAADSPVPDIPSLFQAMFGSAPLGDSVNPRLLPAPVSSCELPALLAASDYTALSNVNITNYDDYAWADPAARAVLARADSHGVIGSLETTHGVIRLASNSPFVFISGIANRFDRFNAEVAPRSYSQNFVAAHNAGIALAWALPNI